MFRVADFHNFRMPGHHDGIMDTGLLDAAQDPNHDGFPVEIVEEFVAAKPPCHTGGHNHAADFHTITAFA